MPTTAVAAPPRPRAWRAERPPGHATRGKTAANRLRRVDLLLALYDPWLIRRVDGPFADAWLVDLGYGEAPATTLEMAARLRRLQPGLRVLGVEIDRARVEAARPFADARTAFRHGGFALPLSRAGERHETVRLVRAMNVLRQYDEAEAAVARRALVDQLLPGGLLVEGTSDPTGRRWVVNVLRRAPAGPATDAGDDCEAIVFGTRWDAGVDPRAFRPVLPKNHIHRVVPGEPIAAFLEAWDAAWRDALRAGGIWGPRWVFGRSARALAADGLAVDVRPALLDRGLLVWRQR